MDEQLQQRLLPLSTALLADARYRLELSETHLDGSIRPAVPVRLERAKDEASADLGKLRLPFQTQRSSIC